METRYGCSVLTAGTVATTHRKRLFVKLRKLAALGTSLVLAAALIGVFMTSANATSGPPWEPDPNALGTITFYDSSGNVVTSGSDLTNMWAYAAGSTNTFSGDTILNQFTKAQIEYSWANSTNPTANWFTKAPYSSTSFPVTGSGVPANISSSDKAVVNATGTGQSSNFQQIESAGTNDTTTGYNHVIQVRLIALGPGGVTTSPNYWATDIQFDPTAGTWKQIYPTPVAAPTPTTTTLSVLPASPQKVGTSVTFTATVAPTAAGTVQFSDNGTAVGGAATVTSGKATWTTTTLQPGAHSITAAFTPADPTAFGASSTTSPLSYTVTSPAARLPRR